MNPHIDIHDILQRRMGERDVGHTDHTKRGGESMWSVCPIIGIKEGLHYKPYNIEGDPWKHKWMNMQFPLQKKFPYLMI
jgi:hypothetical protein